MKYWSTEIFDLEPYQMRKGDNTKLIAMMDYKWLAPVAVLKNYPTKSLNSIDNCNRLNSVVKNKEFYDHINDYTGFGYYSFRYCNCQAGQEILQAQSAKISYLNHFELNEKILKELPEDVLSGQIPKDESHTEVARKTKYSILLRHGVSHFQKLSILGFADVNADHIQDVLISSTISFQGVDRSTLFVLTKEEGDGQLKILKKIQTPLINQSLNSQP